MVIAKVFETLEIFGRTKSKRGNDFYVVSPLFFYLSGSFRQRQSERLHNVRVCCMRLLTANLVVGDFTKTIHYNTATVPDLIPGIPNKLSFLGN